MNLCDINPYIRRATFSTLKAGFILSRRIILDYEIIFVEQGAFTLTVDQTEYPCKTGDVIFLRPGIPHSFKDINTPLSQPHIHFDITYRSDSSETPVFFGDITDCTPEELRLLRQDAFEAFPHNPFLKITDKFRFLKLFYRGITLSESDPIAAKAALTELIGIIIKDNFSFHIDYMSPVPNLALKLRDHIDSGEGLLSDIEDIEKEFSYSYRHMSQLFKKEFGISLMAYRHQKRMEHAKRLLRTESVATVAAAVGFGSIYSFSRAFKAYFGISPSAVKKL